MPVSAKAQTETGAAAAPGAARPGCPGEYAELSQTVKQAGLLEHRPAFYMAASVAVLGPFGAGWIVFTLIGPSWWQMITAVFLGMSFTQVAFIGHDAGHRQIFRGRRANNAVGLFAGNLLVGLSFGWWLRKHNRHHSFPNQLGRDPDVVAGVFVFSASDAQTRRGVARLLTRYQAAAFFPMALLEGLNLHVSSVRAVARRRDRGGAMEGFLLAIHAAIYVTAVLIVLSPLQAVMFVVVQQAVFGLYLGCSFAPNHKGMLMLDCDSPLDYLSRQILTARNIRGGRFMDVVFGGLNYQIEHHLFPTMPRPNLRRCQILVRQFCREHDITYYESGLFSSYAQALRHLRAVAATDSAD